MFGFMLILPSCPLIIPTVFDLQLVFFELFNCFTCGHEKTYSLFHDSPFSHTQNSCKLHSYLHSSSHSYHMISFPHFSINSSISLTSNPHSSNPLTHSTLIPPISHSFNPHSINPHFSNPSLLNALTYSILIPVTPSFLIKSFQLSFFQSFKP